MYPEGPGAQGGRYSRHILEFASEFLNYQSKYDVIDTQRICCPGWHHVLSHLLEYSFEFLNNQLKFSTRGFLMSLDTNITMTMNHMLSSKISDL